MQRPSFFIIVCVIVAGFVAVAYVQHRDDRERSLAIEESRIVLFSPRFGEHARSPVIVSGRARTATDNVYIRIADNDGNAVFETLVPLGESGIGGFTDFSREIFLPAVSGRNMVAEAFWMFSEDEMERNRVSVPFIIESLDAAAVYAFFSNALLNPDGDCERVFPVSRQILATDRMAEAALEMLLWGPFSSERDAGYDTAVSGLFALSSFRVEGGIAYVRLARVRVGARPSCRMRTALSQIGETVRQFPGIYRAVIIDAAGHVFYR